MPAALTAFEVEAIEEFLRTHARYFDGTQSIDEQCVIVSTELARHLPGSRVVWLVGARTGRKVLTEWGDEVDARHAVVCVRDSILVDLTWQQCDPDAPEMKVYQQIDDAGERWERFVDHERPDGVPPRDLPASRETS